MDTQFFDLDINAKLPIIRAESDPLLNDLTNHNQGGDDHLSNYINNNCLNNHQLVLPKPSFRIAQNYDYNKRSHTARYLKKDSYYHYVEPSPDELMKRVEYDMDLDDDQWLKKLNEECAKPYDYTLTENDFEKIIDRLEKESYFESKRSGPEVDEDAVCSICNDGECHDANRIIFCDMCELPVHQECYGVPYIPEGQWLCRRCLQSPSRNVDCVLCPNKGGAFKQTDNNKWAHVICALWIPEVCFANTVFLEPIDSIDHIPQARWKLTCYICKQKRAGACIQCHRTNCYVPFHVTCAQQAGLHMKISAEKYETPDGFVTDVKKVAYCDAHKPKDGPNKGGMYSGDDEDDDDIDTHAYKKWKQENRDKMKKTRKILAEKREVAPNPIAEPTVTKEKLQEISMLLSYKRKRKPPQSFEKMRQELMENIFDYWIAKRRKRNGVPLLRRLQVSYNNNNSARASVVDLSMLDREKYTKLRYDLEKARLLVGEVKKRENFKKKMFQVSKRIVDLTYDDIDKKHPPTA